MNIYWVFLSLLSVVVVGLTIVAMGCILWFGRERSWKFRGMWLGASLLPFIGLCWLLHVMAVHEPDDPQELAKGFAYELHQPLPISVYGLRIRRVGIGDGVGSFVRFGAPSRVVDELIAPFTPSDKATFDRYSGGANVPTWWKPEEEGMVRYYYASGWEPDCSTFSDAVIAHDAAKGIVYFAHSGS